MVKLNSAESIRGLACLAVVFSHLSLSFFPYLHHFDVTETTDSTLVFLIHHSPFAFWYSGTAAVFLFFVLSGFVLSYAILRKPDQIKYKIRSMLIKRYPRLAIPAVASCLIVWMFFQLFDVESSQVSGWLHAYVSQDIDLQRALYEGAIGSFLFAQSDTNWVLWTMHIELFGSLLLFMLLYLYQINRFLFFIGSLLFPAVAFYFKDESFFLGILSFVIGIYFYLYAKTLPYIIAIMIFIFGLYLAGTHNTSWSYQWIYIFLGERTYEYGNFIGGVLIVYSILMSPKLSNHFDHNWLVWFGKLSFSIYLLHLIVLYVIGLPMFNYLLGIGVDYAHAALMASVIFIIFTVCASEYFSRWIDQSSIRISQQLASKILD